MPTLRYALVAYIKGPVGEFVENLGRELHPGLPHLAAHITVLPPRPVHGTEAEALQLLARICGRADPFEVTLGEMESFVPTTCTIFIGVAYGASRLKELHNELNTGALAYAEDWPYVPHVTVGTMATAQTTQSALDIARKRWNEFSGSRRILLDRLTFVREDAPNRWIDLAPVPLGGTLVSS